MPTYNFRNINTNEEFEITMKISELDEYKNTHPELQQLLNRPPSIGDPVRMGLRKPDDSFRELAARLMLTRGTSIESFRQVFSAAIDCSIQSVVSSSPKPLSMARSRK